MNRLLALAALAASACSGVTGTVSVSLATAPGSTLLDSVQTLRMTLTNPHQVTTAERGADGFSLALELPAVEATGAVIVEGLDASGALVANGASPRFPLGGLNAHIVIYMAAPNTLGASRVAIDPPRSEMAAGALAYGAILAGGRNAAGEVSNALAIYNAFDHSILAGRPLPSARTGIALGAGANGSVFLFGGLDDAGAATGTLWRFETTVAPNGAYIEYGDKAELARAGEQAVPLGEDRFLISGNPAIEIVGLNGMAVTKAEPLPPAGASVIATDGAVTSIFVGPSGTVKVRGGAFTPLAIPEAARTSASVVAVPGGKVLVACGGADLVRIDAATGAGEVFPAPARTGCALAATPRFVLVASDSTADLYDTSTLSLVTTLPLVSPRSGAVALALANEQIVIAGGVDSTGAPVGTLELFTPLYDSAAN